MKLWVPLTGKKNGDRLFQQSNDPQHMSEWKGGRWTPDDLKSFIKRNGLGRPARYSSTL